MFKVSSQLKKRPIGSKILSFDDTTFGIQECELNLARLYPDPEDRRAFKKRLEAFVRSDKYTQRLFDLTGNRIIYRTEVFASDRIDDRPPLLLLLGNPASHSVASGMCFAFEKEGREHRFWKGLRETGILAFAEQNSNEARREALLELNYESPFRISIAVFYSIPSPSSAPGWSGVAGVRRLFGARALEELRVDEEYRIDQIVARFIKPSGGLLAFQKGAYEGVRSPDTLEYSRDRANQGLLVGKYKLDSNICLVGAHPTRLMHSSAARRVLMEHKNRLTGR